MCMKNKEYVLKIPLHIYVDYIQYHTNIDVTHIHLTLHRHIS